MKDIYKEIGRKISEVRIKRGLTQDEMAENIALDLRTTYSGRQYQKIEAGEFPKYKYQVIKSVDAILGTNFYEEIYEQKPSPITLRNENNNINNPTDKDLVISILQDRVKEMQDQIKELRQDKAELKSLIAKLEISLSELNQDHNVIMAQIKAASRVAAERFAGSDKKLLAAELRKLDMYVGDFSK